MWCGDGLHNFEVYLKPQSSKTSRFFLLFFLMVLESFWQDFCSSKCNCNSVSQTHMAKAVYTSQQHYWTCYKRLVMFWWSSTLSLRIKRNLWGVKKAHSEICRSLFLTRGIELFLQDTLLQLTSSAPQSHRLQETPLVSGNMTLGCESKISQFIWALWSLETVIIYTYVLSLNLYFHVV